MEELIKGIVTPIIFEAVAEALKGLKSVEPEPWIDRKQLAKYLSLSLSWVDKNLDKIPHSEHPIRFKRSQVDDWMMKKEEELNIYYGKVKITNYRGTRFKVNK